MLHAAAGAGRASSSGWVRGRPDALWALALGAAAFALYLLTLCPTVYWYDSAEYAGAAVSLGIPHAPGYPLYTLLAALFARLPFEPAFGVNLMSASFGAVAVALAFLLSRRLGLSRAAAFLGAATLGAGRLFWSQSVIAEVYTTSAVALLGVLWLLWRGHAEGRAGFLVTAAFVAGLGLGVHLSIATCGVGFALVVLGHGLRVERLRDLRRVFGRAGLGRRLLLAGGCALGALGGACVFLYLPIRSAMVPALLVVDASDWEGFWWLVTGGGFGGWFLTEYDRLARAAFVGGVLYEQVLLVGALLLPVGVALWLRRLPLFGVALLLCAGGNVWFFFDYGVHDAEVFFFPAAVLLALWVGAGAQAVFEALGRVGGAATARLRRLVPPLLAAVFPLSLVGANYGANDRSGDYSARDFGERACATLARDAVVLTFAEPPEWRKDAVFSKYFQLVLGRRPDVRVVASFTPQDALAIFERGDPLYLYEPDPRVAAIFDLREEGDFYRAVRVRRRPLVGPLVR